MNIRYQSSGLRLAALTAIAAGYACVVGACNEQYADAVVRGESNGERRNPTGFGSGSVGGVGGAAGAASTGTFEGAPGLQTLCQACQSDRDCGGFGDLCLIVNGERHCAMSCGSQRDCPFNYDCVDVVSGPEDTWQCLPEDGGCPGYGPTLDEMRAYILGIVNEARERRGLELLRTNSCLTDLGQEAVLELETETRLSTKFNRECGRSIPMCECDWRAESQAFPSMARRTWQEAARYPFDSAAQGNPEDPFFTNVVSSEWGHVGIGVLLDTDYLWFSLEFAP